MVIQLLAAGIALEFLLEEGQGYSVGGVLVVGVFGGCVFRGEVVVISGLFFVGGEGRTTRDPRLRSRWTRVFQAVRELCES